MLAACCLGGGGETGRGRNAVQVAQVDGGVRLDKGEKGKGSGPSWLDPAGQKKHPFTKEPFLPLSTVTLDLLSCSLPFLSQEKFAISPFT